MLKRAIEKKALVFDFDGTIADSLEVVFEIANELAGKFGYRELKKSELQKLRDKKIRDLLREFGVSYKEFASISIEAKKLFNKKIKSVALKDGMGDVLTELKERGFIFAIVTSNSRENAELFLRNNNLRMFDFIYSEKAFFGKDKKIKKFLSEAGIGKENAAYIGDEVRDIEAARKVGMKSISVCWGLNSKGILVKNRPDFIVEEIKDLLVVAKNI